MAFNVVRGNSETRGRCADYSIRFLENSNNVFTLHFGERFAGLRFGGIGPYLSSKAREVWNRAKE